MSKTLLSNFIDLTEEKKLEILSWRNDPNIRVWMYDDSIINKSAHLNFIDTLKDNKSKQYFIVSNEKEDLGVIYFTDISDVSSEFGIYAKPDCKNVGNILMESIIAHGFDTLKLKKLYAEVFENNIKAISLYNRHNLKQIDKRIKNNRSILIMELINENR